MATLSATSLAMTPGTTDPTTITFAATSSNGDVFANTGAQIVIFQNSSSQGAAAINVTIAAQQIDNYGNAASLHHYVITVPTSSMAIRTVGPFSPRLFNNASGQVEMTYSAGGLWVKVVQISPAS